MRITAWTWIGLVSFTIVSWLPARSAPAQPVQTVRYDLPSTPLHIFNLGVVLDFFFTPEPFAEVVKTRFHLVFDTQTAAGNFPAQDLALRLEPPIPSPTVPGELLNETFTGGADFGWSGSTGTFTFDGQTDALDGVAIPVEKGTFARLYLVEIFNARRIIDPGNTTPLGGQFVDSWIEVDFVVPEPSTCAGALTLACGIPMRAGVRRRSRIATSRQR